MVGTYMPLHLLHEQCVCPLLHQLHNVGHTSDRRVRLPFLSLLQFQTYSLPLLTLCQLPLSPPFSASLRTQCHHSRPHG